MKSWQIHFGWAILTVLAVCITARISREQPEVPVPKTVVVAPPAATTPTAPVELPTVLLPEAEAAVPPAVRVAVPTSDAIKKIRMIYEEKNVWQEVHEALNSIQDRGEKLQILRELLVHRKGNSRYIAVQYLGTMKGRDVAELLEAELKSGSDENDRWLRPQIVDALGNVGDPGSVPPLFETLRDSNEEVRLSSAAALLKLGQGAPAGELISSLTRLYESPDGSLRKKAIESIVKLHPEGSLPLLTRALRDTNGDVRLEALYAIGGMEKPEFLPLIEPLVNDPVPEVAREAKDYVESLKEAKK